MGCVDNSHSKLVRTFQFYICSILNKYITQQKIRTKKTWERRTSLYVLIYRKEFMYLIITLHIINISKKP